MNTNKGGTFNPYDRTKNPKFFSFNQRDTSDPLFSQPYVVVTDTDITSTEGCDVVFQSHDMNRPAQESRDLLLARCRDAIEDLHSEI